MTLVMVVTVAVALMAGCSTTQKARNFNGLTTPEGKRAVHLNTTNWAVDLFFVPLIGDASLEKTVSDVTVEAKVMGATDVRVVQSSSKRIWWILPPFTFIIHPVIGNVAVDGGVGK
jgi:hypothetical protein